MKHLGILLVLVATQFGFAASEDDEFSGVLGGMRVEQEDKISLPVEKLEETWIFLREKFVDSPEVLSSLRAGLSAKSSEEQFTDTYFDTPSFQLFDLQSGVRHRRRASLGEKSGGKELVQIKVNGISQNKLERAEYKFAVNQAAPQTTQDRHPLLGLIQADQREDFAERLSQIGIDAAAMKPILEVKDLRRRIYVSLNGKSFSSISLDHVTVTRFGKTFGLAEIEPELNEIAFTEADPATRHSMEETNAKLIQFLKTNLPYLKQDLTPKYNKALMLLDKNLPGVRQRIAEEKIYESQDGPSSRELIGIGVLLLCTVGVLIAVRRFKKAPLPPELQRQA